MKTYKPFNEAREWAMALGLKSRKDWREYTKREDFPSDIRRAPRSYEGWVSMGDWLGTDRIDYRLKTYRPFEEAREWARALGLKSEKDWSDYTKREDFPSDIKRKPRSYEGWVSMGDWLGTGRIAGRLKTYRPFEEAREWARELGLKSGKDWSDYTKREDFPSDIKKKPPRYNEWDTWGDWLGTDYINNKDRIYRPFEEAREWARELGLKSVKDWSDYTKREDFPSDIKRNPYGYEGWVSMGDWLGTGRIADQLKTYRPFEEAREWAMALGLKSRKDWREYTKREDFPSDIKRAPRSYEGWVSMSDFLRYIPHAWSKKMIIEFFKSIKGDLKNLDQIHLVMIIKSANLTNAVKSLDILQDIIYEDDIDEKTKLVDSLEDILLDDINISNDEDISNEEINSNIDELLDKVNDDEGLEEITIEDLGKPEEFTKGISEITNVDDLKVFDSDTISHYFTDETVEFFISTQVNKLWQTLHNDEGSNLIEELRNDTFLGNIFTQSRERFLEQWDGASDLKLPDNYIAKFKPFMMQYATAYRLLKEYKLGNWSGTGAGKTLSAILSAKVIDAKVTIVVGFNSTMDEWEHKINTTFSDCVVYNKPNKNTLPKIDITKNNFLLFNYEKFQNVNSENLVKILLKLFKIDFIVLDEIQFVKHRDEGKLESTRRRNVKNLRIGAGKLNSELRVLGMSATPVINNLEEGKKVLEMVLGEELDDINTNFDIFNGIALHRLMINNGIRCIPDYEKTIKLNKSILEIDGTSLVDDIINHKKNKGHVIELERLLLNTKLQNLNIKKGEPTIIFTIYKENIFEQVITHFNKQGLTVGIYNGDNKTGLPKFLNKECDILLATESIGTGVDGLQDVCNNMIYLILPWTPASYEQSRGRIFRTGQQNNINITIPIVKIKNEERGIHWSWDELRLNRITNKKEWADLVMDGKVPKNKLPSPEKMMKSAIESLEKMIESDSISLSEREKIECPLDLDSLDYINNYQYNSSFTEKNREWNTSLSKTMSDKIKNDPKFWKEYHKEYTESRKEWKEVPFEVIGDAIIKEFGEKVVVADFGCGEDLLRKKFFENNENFHSFDHYAINNKVTACDVSKTPLLDGSMDVVVCSLSLMSKNCEDYIKEANRVLKSKITEGLITTQKTGHIIISEPKNRWKDKEDILKNMLIENGFNIEYNEQSNNFIYIKGIKVN